MFDRNESKKKFNLRSNSLHCEKNSFHEFFRREALRNKKKITEFLKFFIWQVAHCNVLRIFKDYYPKVLFILFFLEFKKKNEKELFVEKISVILTRIQDLQSVQLDQLLNIFKKIKKLRVVIKEDIEVFLFKEDEESKKNPYILMAKIDQFLIFLLG